MTGQFIQQVPTKNSGSKYQSIDNAYPQIPSIPLIIGRKRSIGPNPSMNKQIRQSENSKPSNKILNNFILEGPRNNGIGSQSQNS